MSSVEKNSKIKPSFLSKISHELKSPIHGIMSLADYLDKNWSGVDPETAKKCISEINKSSQSLNLLIDNLFNLSKIQDNEIQFSFTDINFDDAVKDSIAMMGIYIANKHDISISYVNKAGVGKIAADETWFKQLLHNLLINAIKFTRKGQIKVSVDNKNIENKNYFKFSISDEGIGIPEDELTRIFDAFSKGSEESNLAENNGLGLAICEEIVNAHNGDIWAYNNADKGTTVEFIIPKTATI